jgi:hypothetical protein
MFVHKKSGVVLLFLRGRTASAVRTMPTASWPLLIAGGKPVPLLTRAPLVAGVRLRAPCTGTGNLQGSVLPPACTEHDDGMFKNSSFAQVPYVS